METIAFPTAIFYCVSRALYYSMCVEEIKAQSKLRAMENIVTAKAVAEIPNIVKHFVRFRNKKPRL